MPYRKEKFENGDIVHITLRGIDGKLIFRDISDYFRGIFSIYEFNNSKQVSIKERRKIINRFKRIARDPVSGKIEGLVLEDSRDRLVDILCFSFMPNHIHLLVRQIKDDGITKFMQKIGVGYAGYFNRKYKRKGHLFQDTFNAVHIKTEEQLRIVVVYIHTNSLSLIYPEWKKIRIKDQEKTLNNLREYKWSSHLDYIGIKNFPSVTQRDFILDLFGGVTNYQEFIKDYVSWKGDPEEYFKLFLE